MNFISIFGLLALLGLAWILSYHHKQVRLKPVFGVFPSSFFLPSLSFD